LRNIFTTVSGLALLCGIAAFAAPEMTGAIAGRIVDRAEALLAPDCDTRPLECLDRREAALRDALRESSKIATELRTREQDAAAMAATATQNAARNQLFLEEGRRVLSAGGLGPLTFVGVTYDEASLRAQLQLTWRENALLAAHVVAVTTTYEKLSAARGDLVARKTSMVAALEMLPSQRALLRADGMVSDVTASLAGIDALLETGRAARSGAQDALLRSSRELSADSDAGLGKIASGGDFDAWLRAER
jgi:hypothetical protein